MVTSLFVPSDTTLKQRCHGGRQLLYQPSNPLILLKCKRSPARGCKLHLHCYGPYPVRGSCLHVWTLHQPLSLDWSSSTGSPSTLRVTSPARERRSGLEGADCLTDDRVQLTYES